MTASTDKLKKFLLTLSAAAFWILIWQAAALIVAKEVILPSPLAVLKRFFVLIRQRSFWPSVFNSLISIMSGFLTGVFAGTVLAALASRFKLIAALFSPLVKIVRATPVASFIILALLWMGKARVPDFISALIVIPVVYTTVKDAAAQTDPQLLEFARVYKFGPLKTLKAVYIPSVLPMWSSAAVTAMGLAWKSGIAAEILCQPKNAIGSELFYSRTYLETPSLFAWTAVVIFLSFIIEWGFTRLMKGRGKL